MFTLLILKEFNPSSQDLSKESWIRVTYCFLYSRRLPSTFFSLYGRFKCLFIHLQEQIRRIFILLYSPANRRILIEIRRWIASQRTEEAFIKRLNVARMISLWRHARFLLLYYAIHFVYSKYSKYAIFPDKIGRWSSIISDRIREDRCAVPQNRWQSACQLTMSGGGPSRKFERRIKCHVARYVHLIIALTLGSCTATWR